MPGPLRSAHVAFVHTSPVHVETFGRLMAAADPRVTLEHVVIESLLTDAQRVGADDAALVERVQRAMVDAAANGASIVVCTCSTVGGAAERTPTGGRFAAMRIDRAMADAAVQRGPRVCLVAALDSTLAPTARLVEESAVAMHAPVDIQTLLVPSAWSHFLAGDGSAYIDAIVACVRAAPPAADVIVLAQASMAPAAARLQDLGIVVLSSPQTGVQRIIERLSA